MSEISEIIDAAASKPDIPARYLMHRAGLVARGGGVDPGIKITFRVKRSCGIVVGLDNPRAVRRPQIPQPHRHVSRRGEHHVIDR